MLSKKLEEALNKQINAEFWSAYLYLSMSSYLESEGLGGMALWMQKQFAEEQEHAMKLYNYVLDKGGKVLLQPIAAVETKWKGALDVFQATLKHEEFVTSLINDLCSLSVKEKDYSTKSFLLWFVNEQVEEEKNAREIIDKLKLIGKDGYGIYQFDKEMGQRK